MIKVDFIIYLTPARTQIYQKLIFFLEEASDADDDPDFLAKETVEDETDREQLSQCWPFVNKKQS